MNTTKTKKQSKNLIGRSVDAAVLRSAMMHHFVLNLALSGDNNRELTVARMGRPHHRILVLAINMPGISAGEITKMLRVSHQTLAKPLRELAATGYIVLRRDNVDQRVKRVFATSRGKSLLNRTWETQAGRFRLAFEKAQETEIAAYFDLHRRMLGADDLEMLNRLDVPPSTPESELSDTAAFEAALPDLFLGPGEGLGFVVVL